MTINNLGDFKYYKIMLVDKVNPAILHLIFNQIDKL